MGFPLAENPDFKRLPSQCPDLFNPHSAIANPQFFSGSRLCVERLQIPVLVWRSAQRGDNHATDCPDR